MRLPRRLLLGALPLLPARVRASTPLPGAVLALVMSDLHSAQERAPAALAAIDAALGANRGTEAVILVNGDVFERGNVVALRSEGAADWAFLQALRRRAPVVLNLGNHETALIDSMAEVVRRLRGLDILPVSNLRDAASGEALAPPAASIPLRGGRRLVVAGIATDEAMTYRAPVRTTLGMPAPVPWARERLPALLEGADLAVVLSHAGVLADRAVLPLLPPGALLVGGHEHLRFVHGRGEVGYAHTGSWNRFLILAALSPGHAPVLREVAVEPGGAEDPAHAALVRDVMAAHLRPEDREVLFTLPRALTLGDGARRASAAMAAATGAATGLIGHTSFGTGLPAGEVSRLAFDAFLRFDGPLFRADADGSALRAIAARANQEGDVPLEARIGDFVHAHALPHEPAPLAANGWTRLNAARYLGTEALDFQPVAGLMLKPVVAAALRSA